MLKLRASLFQNLVSLKRFEQFVEVVVVIYGIGV